MLAGQLKRDGLAGHVRLDLTAGQDLLARAEPPPTVLRYAVRVEVHANSGRAKSAEIVTGGPAWMTALATASLTNSSASSRHRGWSPDTTDLSKHLAGQYPPNAYSRASVP